MRLTRPLSTLTLGAAAALLCGCPNPNTYTVPRTLDPGKVQMMIAPEAYGFSFKSTTPASNGTAAQTTTVSGLLPTVPSFGIRVGVADGFEIGARVPNLDTVAADFKVRMLKGSWDLAIDPGLQLIYLTETNDSLGVFYLHLPLLVGWNVSDSVTLVASPGVVYTLATASVNVSNNAEAAGTSTGLMARLGVGVDFRLNKTFAIHPEVTFMKGFTDEESLLYIFGVGFNFLALPSYADLNGGGAAPQTPQANQ